MMITLMIPLFLSIYLLMNNTFICMEIPLINMTSFNMPIGISLDWISCMFLSTVMFISSMILTFSTFYMPKKEYKKFSILLMMFVLSMMILIISDNIIFILLGWDGLGLSSYILVIYYQNYSTAASGTITLLSNRIGDIMILLAISITMMNSNWNFNMNEEYQLITMILLLIAASSKSAQFPFSAWLPAAMAAPTPISALVHSSTLVTAGVYLLIRIMNNMHPISISIIMILSSMTAIYASMSANWEQDLKKIIALSTLSQIAMMMFAISMKSTTLAFFHLIIHAMFKSTMFLCAGIMIHNSSYQDMRMMDMKMNNSPLMMSILGLSGMMLMAIPFTSGFFSKDSIIETMISSKFNMMMTFLMIMSIGMTAAYTLRMSFYSNKYFLKSKPDSMSHEDLNSNLPIILMTTLSISLGTSIMWILTPYQILIFPNMFKFLILTTLLTGTILGITLSFKSPTYMKLGESSISLWFIHMLTTSLTNNLSPLMNTFSINDKTWQEMYGPKESFNTIKNMSNLPNLMKTSIMFSLILLTMLPAMTMTM
uniref:NADH-ubiquinone oxidoreductase chain 5 n=1 Tax=Agelena silvatica TaxID=648239 RepID=A0A1P8VZA2_9ARAC|nr:NADH dehydrogenase subunit 5 [Agelena silvatica]APZ84005.1 NADH dehydrogenase subunit 5 [Agelena silvatica]